MIPFPFVAWFLDKSIPVGEQDHEWVACFYVTASNAESAKQWGDAVANAYSSRRPNVQFIRSYIDTKSEGWAETTPKVAYGEMPTDELIGW